MPVTIKVNGTSNSLVHKMSNGLSVATMPDVCKTPSPGGPVPIPYPNIAQSITLSDGTTTVKGDKMMAANKGSKFALSNGDNAGVAGGVKSNVFMKEATWILYSFDVKVDGKNACRFTDKMFHNAENAANLSGEAQIIVEVTGADEDALRKLAQECNDKVNEKKGPANSKNCAALGTAKHKCCEDSIKASKQKTLGAEQPFEKDGSVSLKSRAAAIGFGARAKAAARAAGVVGKKLLNKAFLLGFGGPPPSPGFLANTPPISLDAVIYKVAPPPVSKDNIQSIFDFKFPCGKKGKKGKMSAKQRGKYETAMKPLKVQIIDVLSVV
jgi:uncharacterized protein DUF4150